jgi:ATP-dependent RNA helicase RhlE
MSNYSFYRPVKKHIQPQARYNGRVIRPPKTGGAYIDPIRFVNKAVPQGDLAPFVPDHSFSDFPFEERLKLNVQGRGYTSPTPVQDAAILPILEGKDLIGLANTGSGKTAAILLPILHRIRNSGLPGTSVLIMVPTRELATQIDEEFRAFAWGLNINAALCVGGASLNRQIAQLRNRPQVVIGTPGRLKDLFNQRALRLEGIKILVLDEADRMLDMGFIRDIRFLVAQLPSVRQSLCFSATMPRDIEQLMRELMRDPVTVSVRTTARSEFIDQDVIKASSKEEKLQILDGLLRQPDFDKVLIFGRTKWGVQKVADQLSTLGHRTESIHGNKSQPQRQRALNAFKANQIKVLVATDVAARGLDIPDVSHVINFDIPNTYDDYIHRIGRTGRIGKSGHALTFIS